MPLNDRVAVCEPLAIAFEPKYARSYCNYCLFQIAIPVADGQSLVISCPELPNAHAQSVINNQTASNKLSKITVCPQCDFVAYCSEACQQNDKTNHERECRFLKGKFIEWLRMDKLWSEDNIGPSAAETALLMIRLLLQLDAGILDDLKGAFSTKTFDNLESHADDIRKSLGSGKSCFNHLDHFIRKTILTDEKFQSTDCSDQLFNIYCKICINSHSIFEWTSNCSCKIVGIALGLDMSAYDHSCRPNVQVFWFGRKVYFVPLDAKTDAHNPAKAFISYKNLIDTKVIRRQKLLKDYFFTCQCTRCMDVSDNLLSGFLCLKCSATVPMKELAQQPAAVCVDSSKSLASAGATCPKCDTLQPLTLQTAATELMLQVDDEVSRPGNPDFQRLAPLFQRCMQLLPKANVYFTKLIERLVECPEVQQNSEMTSNCWLHIYNTTTVCLPCNSPESLHTMIRTCHALLVSGDFFKARGLFCEIEKIAENYFVLGVCPFRRLMAYFYDCIRRQQKPKVSFWASDA